MGLAGLFKSLYSRQGAPMAVQSSDIRLGGLASVGPEDILGIPVWLILVVFLGFAIAHRRNR